MNVSELITEIAKLSVDDYQQLRNLMLVSERFQTHRRGERSASFDFKTESFGRIEGTFHFGPMLKELSRRFEEFSAPENIEGKRVNDGKTIVIMAGRNRPRTIMLDGPSDGSVIQAKALSALNLLSDPAKYEFFFQEALQRLAEFVEDAVVSEFENKEYLAPNRIEKRIDRYAKSKEERRDNTWRPPLRKEQRLPKGRPRPEFSATPAFTKSVTAVIRDMTRKGLKVTQIEVAAKLGITDRALRSNVEIAGMKWSEIKNRK